ncbi:Similar to Lip3: Lipase 3 (Drosophila melanogaster) [Cotesia congregata]|uniref:Lipase n=1 Tax=Cotesia congregata TaxID=51543 RepID=A0A8J2H261_COTCN|nr:Similar to Lip3: Lipase 3 (Drosophila melanogaster) [Cotesia congregata]
MGLLIYKMIGSVLGVSEKKPKIRIKNLDSRLESFIDLVEESGYLGEEHRVKTEDGYDLTVHRIPGGPQSPVRFGKPVILLLHGLMSASDIWILRGPGQDLAYLLSDAGYDVWAINVRGNYYSTLHNSITNNSAYWDYSWHENGMYDVPATINYILSKTRKSELSLLGYSMGGTEILVLLSSRPEFNHKINIAITWAPAALVSHDIPGFFPNFLFRHSKQIKDLFSEYNLYQVMPRVSKQWSDFLNVWFSLCWRLNIKSICLKLLDVTLGFKNLNDLDLALILRIKDHYPQGTSLKTILHYGQVFKNRRFQQYDYGKMINLIKYNDMIPPEYPLNKITTPLIIYYARNDKLVTKNDVEMMLKKIPTAIAKEVPDDKFGHLDFIISKNIKHLVYDRIDAIDLVRYRPPYYIAIAISQKIGKMLTFRGKYRGLDMSY